MTLYEFQIPVFLLVLHFITDFVMQSDWMALNKSKRWDALGIHCAVYSLAFLPFLGVVLAAWVFITHFLTDAITSRITSWLWSKGERHWFFVVIGVDQLIHAVGEHWCRILPLT